MGRPVSHRERVGHFLYRIRPWPHVSDSHELLYVGCAQMASYGLPRLDRWNRTSRIGYFTPYNGFTCSKVWDWVVAAFVRHVSNSKWGNTHFSA